MFLTHPGRDVYQWFVPWQSSTSDPRDEDSSVSAAPTTRRYRVLAAEDDPALRRMLGDALALDGFDACCVEDGRAARIALGASGPYDAVLLDDRMPHVTGRQLLSELRAAGVDVPVLLLSGSCDMDERERARLRPSAILLKPVRMADVSRALRAAIEQTAIPVV
jgi:DNA-binding response OmpR family regulator